MSFAVALGLVCMLRVGYTAAIMRRDAVLRVTAVVLLIVATVALRLTWETTIPRAEAQDD